MYLRFATFRIDPDAQREQGIFQASYDLIDGGDLHPAESTSLKGALEYFERDLAVPSVYEPRAVFWFKCQCRTCTRHGWLLARALEMAGLHVVPVLTRKPGLVVYEDGCQIAADPFRDTFEARRLPTPVCRAGSGESRYWAREC